MTESGINQNKDIDFRNVFTAGLAAGLVGVLLNNFYSYLYTALTGFALPELIHVGTITLASFFSCLFGSIAYFGLTKVTKHPRIAFMFIGGIVTLVSLAGPLTATMPDGSAVPDGFAGLTIPMHLISGISAIMIIPFFAHVRPRNI